MASRSPTAFTPLPRPTSVPETPLVKDTPVTPQAVPFPPPQTFDIIPPLHGLLLRLLASPGTTGHGVRASEVTNGGSGPVGQPTSAPGQPHSQPGSEAHGQPGVLVTVPSAGPGPVSASAELAALGSNVPPPLDIKDLPTEVSSIKIRIQKAQAVVENLPDVDRSVAEQEEEIRELEDRIAKLKTVISDFGRRASP
ncbi:RNA polymerase II mediator complex middle subunit MED9, partial [Aspergillus saccharolyticus JOP 1030-1]